jgi:hypothetical protein
MYGAAGEAGNGEGNVIFSPYSISLAFSLAYAGARGETETEMAETLNFLPQETQHPAFNAIESRMYGLGEKNGGSPARPSGSTSRPRRGGKRVSGSTKGTWRRWPNTMGPA